MLGIEPLAQGPERTCLDMTSGEDRPLPRAPVIRRTGGQAVKRAGDSRRPSCRGSRHPPSTPGGRTRPFETHVARHAKGAAQGHPIVIYRTSGDHM
jgi:hypothetical protein